VLPLEAHHEAPVGEERERLGVPRVLALRHPAVGAEQRAHLDVLDVLEAAVSMHEPRADPPPLVRDRDQALAVRLDADRGKAPEPGIVRREVEAAPVHEAADDALARVLRVQGHGARAHGHRIGREGRRESERRQNERRDEAHRHDGRGG
jgi:hypothetical protein